jgi:hypothetical protein
MKFTALFVSIIYFQGCTILKVLDFYQKIVQSKTWPKLITEPGLEMQVGLYTKICISDFIVIYATFREIFMTTINHFKLARFNGRKCVAALTAFPFLLSSCSSYHLSESTPAVTINKLKHEASSVCGIAPFNYQPVDTSDQDLMTQQDLAKWNDMFFQNINLSDICAETIRIDKVHHPTNIDYIIDGTLKKFYFKKNWVPMLFPLHIAISFFTLSIYTWAAGPTTSTKVNLEYFANIKDAKTGKVILSVPETFASTDVMTIYSRDTENPYGNPGLAPMPLS